MNRSTLARAALFFVVCLVCRGVASGCSLAIPPIKGFNESEYVFIGKVLGVAGPLKSKELGVTWGLLVGLDEEVYLPETPSGNFEVIPYHLAPDCGDVPWDRETLVKFFPVGTPVRVVGIKSKYFAARNDGGDARLDVYLYDRGILARNERAGGDTPSASSVYEYGGYKKYPEEYTDENAPLVEAHYTLPEFELRKDLLRLKRAATEEERAEILERLADYPSRYEFDFQAVAEAHAKDPETLKRILKKREAVLEKLKPTP